MEKSSPLGKNFTDKLQDAAMEFHFVPRGKTPPISGRLQAYLKYDNWNDYSFVTLFEVTVFDETGKRFDLGSVKIGFLAQTIATATASSIEWPFTSLPASYFSLGQDVSYYAKLSELSDTTMTDFLNSIQDVVWNEHQLEDAREEDVFITSLTRYVSVTNVTGQFRKALRDRKSVV